MSLTRATTTLGAYLPNQCQFQEVIDSVAPRFIQEKLFSKGKCGKAYNGWSPFSAIMLALTCFLVGLVVVASGKDWVSVLSCPLADSLTSLHDVTLFCLCNLITQWDRKQASNREEVDAANDRTDDRSSPTLPTVDSQMSTSTISHSQFASLSARKKNLTEEVRVVRPTIPEARPQGGMPGGRSAAMALLSCFSLYRNIPLLLAPSRQGKDITEAVLIKADPTDHTACLS